MINMITILIIMPTTMKKKEKKNMVINMMNMKMNNITL